VRVTLDEALEFQILAPVSPDVRHYIEASPIHSMALAMKERFRLGKDLVLELKHSGEKPAWLAEFLGHHGVRNASFSKYCFSMSQELTAGTMCFRARPNDESAVTCS
jgi:hypothetical protein